MSQPSDKSEFEVLSHKIEISTSCPPKTRNIVIEKYFDNCFTRSSKDKNYKNNSMNAYLVPLHFMMFHTKGNINIIFLKI